MLLLEEAGVNRKKGSELISVCHRAPGEGRPVGRSWDYLSSSTLPPEQAVNDATVTTNTSQILNSFMQSLRSGDLSYN
jgi:hypothetical protein